ncbi:unnamed protein product [Oppiella nova]|uniref:Ubiquitin-like domain-containing protein n=1 Tax=Oppiella nova TaxID=334625 RepID=A0A7R9QK83_9ACAR|nr:unnamed protein product [Oppiella nova]CAG2167583.1 unnamed protein product [Oppiella nova]
MDIKKEMDVKPNMKRERVVKPYTRDAATDAMILVSVQWLYPEVDKFWQPVATYQTVVDLKRHIRASLVDRDVVMDETKVDVYWRGGRLLDTIKISQILVDGEYEVELRPRKVITNGTNSGANTSTTNADNHTYSASNDSRQSMSTTNDRASGQPLMSSTGQTSSASKSKSEPMEVITIDDDEDSESDARPIHLSTITSSVVTNGSGTGRSTPAPPPTPVALAPVSTNNQTSNDRTHSASNDSLSASTSTPSTPSSAPIATNGSQTDSDIASTISLRPVPTAQHLFPCPMKGCVYKCSLKSVLTCHQRYCRPKTGDQLKLLKSYPCEQVSANSPQLVRQLYHRYPVPVPRHNFSNESDQYSADV